MNASAAKGSAGQQAAAPKLKGKAGSGVRASGQRQAAEPITIEGLQRQGRVPTAFSQRPAAPAAAKSHEELLAELKAGSAPGQTLSIVCAEQRSQEAAVADKYTVSTSQPTPKSSAAARAADSASGDSDDSLLAEQKRLKAKAAQRAAEKEAAAQRALETTAGKGKPAGKGKTAGKKAARAQKTPEEQVAIQVKARGKREAAEAAAAERKAAATAKAAAKAKDAAEMKAAADAKAGVNAQPAINAKASADAKAAANVQAAAESKAAADAKAAVDAKTAGDAKPAASRSPVTTVMTKEQQQLKQGGNGVAEQQPPSTPSHTLTGKPEVCSTSEQNHQAASTTKPKPSEASTAQQASPVCIAPAPGFTCSTLQAQRTDKASAPNRSPQQGSQNATLSMTNTETFSASQPDCAQQSGSGAVRITSKQSSALDAKIDTAVSNSEPDPPPQQGRQYTEGQADVPTQPSLHTNQANPTAAIVPASTQSCAADSKLEVSKLSDSEPYRPPQQGKQNTSSDGQAGVPQKKQLNNASQESTTDADAAFSKQSSALAVKLVSCPKPFWLCRALSCEEDEGAAMMAVLRCGIDQAG